jgi:hypothetical protein
MISEWPKLEKPAEEPPEDEPHDSPEDELHVFSPEITSPRHSSGQLGEEA